MRKVTIGKLTVTGLCIGGNPFSGFSHQSEARTQEMLAYHTPERILATLRAAEEAGVNSMFSRTDDHIFGIIREYRKQGGKLQWFAQVRADKENPDSWKDWMRRTLDLGCSAAYMHGGETDFWYANGRFDNFREALEMMRKGGVTAGFAGHRPDAHAWIRDNLDVDFQMCSHYNPTDRSKSAHHVSVGEKWNEEDRRNMLAFIPTVRKPVVHYKVFAGGNRPIVPAFETLGQVMRPNDVACVGMFLKDDPKMIVKDVKLFEKYVDRSRT